MDPITIATIGKTVGVALGSLLMALLTGKTIKALLWKPLHSLAEKTENTTDDIVVENVRKDWGLSKEDVGESDVVSDSELHTLDNKE